MINIMILLSKMNKLENLSQDQLEELARSYEPSNTNTNKKKKKGIFGRLFGRKNKMANNSDVNDIKQEVAPEVKTPDTNNQQLKTDIENIIKEPVKPEEISKNNVQTPVENNQPVTNEEVIKEIDKKLIRDDIPQEMIDKTIEQQQEIKNIGTQIANEFNNQKEVKNSFNEKADFKIATFQIKVENKDVGAVLTLLGKYADELNALQQVKHCDLNIVDENK